MIFESKYSKVDQMMPRDAETIELEPMFYRASFSFANSHAGPLTSQFLYLLRVKRGLSQVELAEMVGVVRQAVSAWEMDLSAPQLDLLPSVSAALDLTTPELIAQGCKDGGVK